jgi:hypothetical protein
MKRYKGGRNFRESPKGEVRRIPIPRTSVDKGKNKGRGEPYAPARPPSFRGTYIVLATFCPGSFFPWVAT